jgi:hypothetical protein
MVIRTNVGVDVFSDNTSHLAVLPPTTPPPPVCKDTNKPAALSATTSTPAITTHTLE